MSANTIMVQGTASHVGKSVLVAALCRIFYRDGYRVAPFKSQNMALNSFVTRDGGEMGRATVVQAEASVVEPHVDMNPVLLKPTGHASSQVVLMGKPIGNKSAYLYHREYAEDAWGAICDSLHRLSHNNDVIVIEGAGSPAEVNLQDCEIVNMRVAREANAPVLLAADIDKGGALASVVGTLELLSSQDRERVAGIIINKFRGDISLFQPAVDFLEKKTGKPVIGVIPYIKDLKVQEEDTIPEDKRNLAEKKYDSSLDVAVVNLPHISNFTDFDPLESEPDVYLRYAGSESSLGSPDLIILPGTKNTIEDLVYLKQSGIAGQIQDLARNGTCVLGICGGFQMLGRELRDYDKVESSIPVTEGINLLDITTVFTGEKVTHQVEANMASEEMPAGEIDNYYVSGYEIHMGRTEMYSNVKPAFNVWQRSGINVCYDDGAVNADGKIMGTYIHGILDNDYFRRELINKLRVLKGWEPLEKTYQVSSWELRQREYDRLAELVKGNIDVQKLYEILHRVE
ncbi:MAG: cobyric acid synthase [Clostridiales bacterium]|nr:cobyric acid synthase [Clostridiales bacterium]MCF8023397.1 cobyric acid synthase [Clostridiales bacterium]